MTLRGWSFITSKRFYRGADIVYYVLLAALAVGLIAVRLNVMKIIVPSGSMLPTLEIGDVLYCWKGLNTESLQRGSLVVFYNEELDLLMIKRIIGLPGEVVEIKDGTVFINGEDLVENYVLFCDSDRNGTFVVPEGHYFLLGDNRKNSNDARYWVNPFISFENLKAVAKLRVSPSSRFGFV